MREGGESWSLTLGMEGGLGLRPGGWLQPERVRRSFNLVDLEAPGDGPLVTQREVSAPSRASAALVLLEDLLLSEEYK